MPEYLSPGVYIQEVQSGPRPIEGAGTATAAFVGFAADGPVNQPTLVTNWTQYVNTFGRLADATRREPHMKGSYLSHAVFGFFQNGGGRCFVTRVSTDNGSAPEPQRKPLQIPTRGSKAVPSLVVTPRSEAAGAIQVEVAPSTGETPPEDAFTLRITSGGVDVTLPNVNLDRNSPDYVATRVNADERARTLVEVAEARQTSKNVDRMPEHGSFAIAAPEPAIVSVKPNQLIGSAPERSGVEGLQIAEQVTMVCCPDLMAPAVLEAIGTEGIRAVQTAMIAHCTSVSGRMAILDAPPNLTPQQMINWRAEKATYDSPHAALYYPWVNVTGPDGETMAVPPCGHIAGLWARVDNSRGVHKAPANEVLLGVIEPSIPITKGEQDLMNPNGVNCIRSFPNRGTRVWGARTLSSDPAWRYISVRRLFDYVEKSIEVGLQWVVFEPNNQDLWARVRRDVGAFLLGVWREGMLFGATPQEAFFVKCDEELNPQDVRDRGQLFIDIGLAPVKPAEFVIFRFSQYAGGGA